MDTTTTALPTTEPTFESLGALFAYEYRTHGADHLKAVLTGMIEDGEQRREHLEKAACETKALALHKVADLVLEAAKQCAPMSDLSFCPYKDGEPGSRTNLLAWQRGEQRRAEKKHRECIDLLRQAGINIGWLNGEIRQ
jgi:hypothetical protein